MLTLTEPQFFRIEKKNGRKRKQNNNNIENK